MKHRTPRASLTLSALILCSVVLPAFMIGSSQAAFTGQTGNTGSSLAAATKFWPSGLVHYWPLEGDAVDTVGSADGTLTGTTDVAGRVDNALHFDEVDDHIIIPDFIYPSEFSIAFDFKIDSNAGSLFKYAYTHGNIDNNNSINIFVNETSHGTDPDVLRTVARDSNDTLDNFALQTDISSFVGDGLWHTYVLIVDAATGLTVYIDGAIAATDSTRGTDGFDPSGTLYVGVRDDLDSARFFGGNLDTVQIYDHPLSPLEITDQAS